MRILLLFLLMTMTHFFYAQQKNMLLSANTKHFLWKRAQLNTDPIFPENVYRKDVNGKIYLSAFIEVNPQIQMSALKALDVISGSKNGSIWTVHIPFESMDDFLELEGIDAIELDRPIETEMDAARLKTHSDSVHQGIGLPQKYSGKDVVVGIIDAGFDYSHPAFFDTSCTNYRVKAVWEQKAIGIPPLSYGFGAEYTDSLSIINKQTDNNNFSHGAHVAGIAAGSGYGGPGNDHTLFRGMAYESDIVKVGIMPDMDVWMNTGLTDLMDGISYVFDYAAAQNKPAVANISWGGPLGSHDGMGLFSKACDLATGQGRAITVSAGNNNGKKVHLGKTFSSSDTMISTVIGMISGPDGKMNWVDIWGDSSETFCVQFQFRTFFGQIDTTAVLCITDSTNEYHLLGANGDTCKILISSSFSDINGKPHMLIDIRNHAVESLIMSVISSSGTVNMWQGVVLGARGYYAAFSKDIFFFCENGNSEMAASDMASTASIVAVGAYSSKANFTNISGQSLSFSQSIDDLATFSSHGPTMDGRTKPDITGPGSALASAINSSDPIFQNGGSNYDLLANQFSSPINNNSYCYAYLQGTSMSSPAVAGIIALMLEANPSLNPQQIQYILKTTAIKDSFTGPIGNNGDNRWGWGKINAYAAVQSALSFSSSIQRKPEEEQVLKLYPNPATDIFELEIHSDHSSIQYLQIIDLKGTLISSRILHCNVGTNHFSINVDFLPPSIYVIKTNDGSSESVGLINKI